MPNGFLNISHNFAGELNYIIVEWVKSTAQGTPVIGHVTGTGLGAQNDTDQTEVFYPAAHVNEQLQVINLPEVWMLVRFWRSSDGIAKDVLLLQLAGNARTGAIYPISRYEYRVDRGQGDPGVWSDPVQDDQGLRDTRLADQYYWVEKRGMGTYIEGELTDRSDDGGGFDFVDVDEYMESGQTYVVYVVTRIETSSDDSGIPDTDDSDIFILDTNQDYVPLTMGGRTLIADFSTTVGILTIPNLVTVADGKFRLQTHTGGQRNVIIQFDAGDTIEFRKNTVNKIILGEGEEIEILIKNNVATVLAHFTNHDNLGEEVNGYRLGLNRLPGDGGARLLADYPRVEELLDSLPATSVVNDTTWNTSSVAADGQTVYLNKGKWMRDGANFRPPLLEGKVIKGVSQATVTGRYEHQEMMAHEHFIASPTDSGGLPYLSASHSTGGNLGYNFNGSTVAPTLFKTGPGGGVNNIVNNIGLYPLLHI